MNKTKHLLLWSSVGVWLLLVVAAVQENYWREWRQVQASATAPDGPLEIRLRQVVNPTLNISDRCVSCHVGMAPGESGISGPRLAVVHKPVVHDPAEMGCTTCHGGQGAATDKDDAHGDVHFWPEPMLAKNHLYAGCGSCHTTLNIPNAAVFEHSRSTFERLDCLACHRVDGRGGTLRPDKGGMEGPDLSRVGMTGFKADWYPQHLAKHNEAQTGVWKTSFGPISEADQKTAEAFLSTRVAAPRLVEAKAQFHSLGCMGCHKIGGGMGGDAGVDLARSGLKDPGQLNFAQVPGAPTLSNWLAEHFRSPAGLVAGSQMPMLGLSENQIELLTLYVLSLRRRDVPGSYLPKDRVSAMRFNGREFSSDGATLFSALCSGCHGATGQGMRYPGLPPFPAIGKSDFLSLVSDEFLTETITKGRPGRKMPKWGELGLKPEDVAALIGYLRQLSVTPAKVETTPARWVKADPNWGRQLFAASCAGCHGTKGEGIEGPALNNQVFLRSATDSLLTETIKNGRQGTAMRGFSQPSSVFPALTPAEIEAVTAFIRTWEEKKP
ncbi:MAG: c-type cytochrome [Blastocatellia bacterium]|nr:c-type cytochrome [Blastocatellia bacterium]